jgi:hypothetical protein
LSGEGMMFCFCFLVEFCCRREVAMRIPAMAEMLTAAAAPRAR